MVTARRSQTVCSHTHAHAQSSIVCDTVWLRHLTRRCSGLCPCVCAAPLIVRARRVDPSYRGRGRVVSDSAPLSSRFLLPSDADLERRPFGERHVLVPAIYFLDDDLGLPEPAPVLQCEAIAWPPIPLPVIQDPKLPQWYEGWPFQPMVVDYKRLELDGVNVLSVTHENQPPTAVVASSRYVPPPPPQTESDSKPTTGSQILLHHQQYVRGAHRLDSATRHRLQQQQRQPDELVLLERQAWINW